MDRLIIHRDGSLSKRGAPDCRFTSPEAGGPPPHRMCGAAETIDFSARRCYVLRRQGISNREQSVPTVTDLSQGGVWSLISHSGPVVQLVLLILVAFSVASWAIILSKQRTLVHARRRTEEFLDAFWKNQRLDALYDKSEAWIDSPVSKVFRAGYRELSRLHGVVVKAEADADVAAAPETSILQNVSRAMSRARNLETTRLERALTFLATTGSSTPFIGLFGTVWGIMNAFQSIGLSGSASLAVVAPGISEALIATAVGLAAAIPAVIAYNTYLRRVETLTIEMENFSDEFMNLVDRFYAAQLK